MDSQLRVPENSFNQQASGFFADRPFSPHLPAANSCVDYGFGRFMQILGRGVTKFV